MKRYETYLMHTAWERGIVDTAKEEGRLENQKAVAKTMKLAGDPIE